MGSIYIYIVDEGEKALRFKKQKRAMKAKEEHNCKRRRYNIKCLKRVRSRMNTKMRRSILANRADDLMKVLGEQMALD